MVEKFSKNDGENFRIKGLIPDWISSEIQVIISENVSGKMSVFVKGNPTEHSENLQIFVKKSFEETFVRIPRETAGDITRRISLLISRRIFGEIS